jgi:tetratricopeptide (TPR) repeat protein
MIAVVALLAAGMFVVTHYVARSFQREQQHQAQYWFERSQLELKNDQAQQAINSLHSALAYSRDNFQYRLRLAEALIGEQDLRQAQSYLLALWDQQPGNGVVNLELARIQARNGNYQQAVRYYHGAVYGIFDQNPEEQRRRARFELVNYLLRVNAAQQAQAELIALAGDLPRDPEMHIRAGKLFQQAHEQRRALDEYRAALEIQPRNVEALQGAGEAAFNLDLYADAQRSLQRAQALGAKDSHSAELLQLATLVRQMNPFTPRLSLRERARRTVVIFNQAHDRLQACATQQGTDLERKTAQVSPGTMTSAKSQVPNSPAAGKNQSSMPAQASVLAPPNDLQLAYQPLNNLKRQMRTSVVMRDPELADAVLDAAAQAEQAASKVCGAATGRDEALLLIWSQREQSEQ